ncbi:EamA family transporter RarD [Otariodibacter oris]|uniref:Chloramphenicol-sensitive protein RarD n=1 Tax=Otariodibacter oris TaxID=1032623 RepID=A0A420XHN8_9PAST|nr:EamA family transporter RarD [Otariodibacter oris]QGM81046.1 permease [Otariodibacter oris]RKR76769.1 chloramphenicol-sensitive protein RarD [Otariodibacter oris]
MLKGVLLSLGANVLFGMGFYFAILLQPLPDMGMFGFRILVLIPMLLLAIFLFNQQAAFKDLARRIKEKPWLIGFVVLLACNLGAQLWLFLWAPNNGQAIQVSIGYLLLPIVTAAMGKIVFKEYFSPFKWLALAFACVGVGASIFLNSEISWATFLVAFGYSSYIVIRRYFNINTLATFVVELIICLPWALYYVLQLDMPMIISQNEYLYYYLILFGVVNGFGFICFVASSNILPVNVLGLMGYVEPLVMLIISFAIGEVLDSQSYILMACLSVAILLLTLDSFRKKA